MARKYTMPSKKEKLEIVKRVLAGSSIRVWEPEICRRQVREWVKKYQAEGEAGLEHLEKLFVVLLVLEDDLSIDAAQHNRIDAIDALPPCSSGQSITPPAWGNCNCIDVLTKTAKDGILRRNKGVVGALRGRANILGSLSLLALPEMTRLICLLADGSIFLPLCPETNRGGT